MSARSSVASIAKDPNGRKRILFVNGDGERKAIRLGKMSLPDAREVKSKVEAILSANVSRKAFDNPTAAWVADIPDSLAAKLAQVGLIPKRDQRKKGIELIASGCQAQHTLGKRWVD